MSYTHYWTPTRAFDQAQFEQLRTAVETIISVASIEPWSIGIDLQRSTPTEIWLNGAPLAGETEDEVTHETFCLSRDHTSFQFCKTVQKPYDTVVVACLIAAEMIARASGFSMALSSDGDNEDLQAGAILYAECFPGTLDGQDIELFEGKSVRLLNPETGLTQLTLEPATEHPLEPIHSFSDHPSFKYRSGDAEVLYLISGDFFIASHSTQPQEVILRSLGYTNLGEPYRELARLNYSFLGSGANDSIDIEFSDAAQLLFWYRCKGLTLEVAKDMANNRTFNQYWQDLVDPD